jgi:hypothetical protein
MSVTTLPSHTMDLFTNRLLWLGASARDVSLRVSGCRNLALCAFMNKSHTPSNHSECRPLLQNLTHTTGP